MQQIQNTIQDQTARKCTPFYVHNPLCSVQMPQIPGVSVLLFVITSPFEEKMNAFPSLFPLTPPLISPSCRKLQSGW